MIIGPTNLSPLRLFGTRVAPYLIPLGCRVGPRVAKFQDAKEWLNHRGPTDPDRHEEPLVVHGDDEAPGVIGKPPGPTQDSNPRTLRLWGVGVDHPHVDRRKYINDVPPLTPTPCSYVVRLNKEDV